MVHPSEETSKFIKYLTYEKGFSEHTITSYSNDISQFKTFIASRLGLSSLYKVKHTHVRSWIVQLMQDKYSAKSVNRKLSSLKSYYKFLKKISLVKINPTSKISGPRLPNRLPTVIKEEHLKHGFMDNEKQINECQDFSAIRDDLIVHLLYEAGLRRTELIKLREEDVNFARKEIKVLGKGSKERLIPITVELANHIDRYLSSKKNEDFSEVSYLLVTDQGKPMYPKFVYNKVKRWLTLFSTSEKKSPHVLRHSFATHLANNGAELNAIKELLGHASLAATEVYMHNSVERLKEVYQKSHPRMNKKR